MPKDPIDRFFLKPKTGISEAETDKLNDLLILSFVSAILPTSLVDNAHFREFIHSLNDSYSLPHRTKLTKMIDSKFAEVKQKVIYTVQNRYLIELFMLLPI